MRARSSPCAWGRSRPRIAVGGLVLDHAQNLGSEPPNQLLRENWPNALDQAAAEVPLDPLGVVGGTVFIVEALNWSPCSLYLTHPPAATSHSPAVTEGNDPTTRCFLPVPLCFYS